MADHAPPEKVGKLVDVELSRLFTHEAYSFTPWLAKNLDRLSDVLGITLELTGTEQAVGSFSADILAFCPEDGTRVLIENQIAKGDHTHLGQIMTYLAGLDAQTIVWIAADFNEAHLSAIKWLNEHTVDLFSFFAIRVRAVQIGQSDIAPLFDVVERPNDWERSIQKAARERTGTSELNAFWPEWWTFFFDRYPSDGERPFALSARWLPIPDTPLYAGQFISDQSVGVYFRGDRGVTRGETLRLVEPHLDELTTRLGVPIGPGGKPFLFLNRLNIDTHDRANWPAMADWLHSEAARYAAEVSAILKDTP